MLIIYDLQPGKGQKILLFRITINNYCLEINNTGSAYKWAKQNVHHKQDG
jgi:hypothetical protein